MLLVGCQQSQPVDAPGAQKMCELYGADVTQVDATNQVGMQSLVFVSIVCKPRKGTQ